MKEYKSISEVQKAYLDKALSSETPVMGVFRDGKLVASSTASDSFMSAENCEGIVVAKVAKKFIKNGKVQDEAPILVISAPKGFLDNAKEVYAFTTPALGENNLKPTKIENEGFLSAVSVCTFPAKHNFAVKSKPIEVKMYQSVFGGYYTQEQLPEQDQAKCLEKYSSEVKQERNARIADTDDYERLSDITVKKQAKAKREPLTDEEKAQVTAYRKALRDFPETQGFPFVAFPEIPSCIAFECNEKIEQRKQMEAMR